MNRRHFVSLAAAGLAAPLTGCGKKPNVNADGKPVIRFGHFPNITHVQGLVARQLSRKGKGWYEERLGAEIQWFAYNAGPSATEAIFARALDVTYIGPSPTLNAYTKSKGSEMRILAGAANGGSSLLVRADAGIEKPEDFRGKKIATPQLGNTQDIQLRAWLGEHGIKVTQTGGDATILPTQNPDQISMMVQKNIDAVWTVEPWVTRLEREAGAKIFLQDTDTNVTMLTARAAWLDENLELAKKLKAAHLELTEWVQKNPAEASALVKAELTDQKLPPKDEVLASAFGRVIITGEISRQSLDKMVASAQAVGFLSDIPSLDKLLPAL